MPTVDNVNNWFHADKNFNFEHKVTYVGEHHHRYPIIGVILRHDVAFPAAWDFTGNCLVCGDMSIYLHRFNLLPIDGQQAWLTEELADLWKYVEPEFKWCTIDKDGTPEFWTHRPQFKRSARCWKPEPYTVQKAYALKAVKIDTRLPVKMTLQERPVED